MDQLRTDILAHHLKNYLLLNTLNFKHKTTSKTKITFFRIIRQKKIIGCTISL